MAQKLNRKLLVWWVLTIMFVLLAHLVLERTGWDRPGDINAEAVLAALLIAALLIPVNRLVLRPLKAIGGTAERIRGGDLSARVRVDAPEELRTLSDTLNGMVEALASAYEQARASTLTLEKAVEARTFEVTVERDKLGSILKSIPDGLVFIGISGEITAVNPMMEEIWGVKAGELAGRTVDELPPGPLRDSLTFKCEGGSCKRCWEVFNCIEKKCPAYMSEDVRCWLISGTYCRKGVQVSVKRKREDICSQCEMYREVMAKCGEVRELEIGGRSYKVSGALVLDKGNRVLGEIKSFSDVTEEKLLEKRKADFVSLITHDLKSPLTSIMGYADLLLSIGQEKTGESAEYAESIKQNSRRLLDMVEQYLDLSRMEAGMLLLKKRPVRLKEVVEEALSGLEVQAREKGMSVSLELDPGMEPVEADREKMVRVASNLLSNAIKYTPRGGSITVVAREAEDEEGRAQAELSVLDTGPGISEEDLPRIFDRYYRSGRTSGVKGSGLGLAVVKSLVEAHGGEVSAVNRPEGGSAFTVRIPVSTSTETRDD